MKDDSPIVTETVAYVLVKSDGLDPARAEELVGLTMMQATAKVGQWLREAEKKSR